MANVINWFEIPAANYDRAAKFYGTVLDGDIHLQEMGDFKMGFLPGSGDGEGVGGAIVEGEGYTPTDKGSVIYLNGGNDLSTYLSRVADAGGNVVMPKTKISDEIGFYALFLDSEGNKVAFHSPN